MAGPSKQLSYTLLPSRHSVCSAIVQRRDSRSCTSVPCQRTEAKYRISDIFLERHVGNIFGFSSVQRSQYFILPMSYRGWGGVAIGSAGRDHFNTRSRYKFRSLAGSTVWWPNKRPARVQLAKILASLISVTYPIATGVRCYCPIVQSSLNPLVLSDNHFQSPHFVPPPPAFHVLPQFSPIYTAVGFRVWFLWKRQRDLAKSDFWFGEIHSPLENPLPSCGAAAATFAAANIGAVNLKNRKYQM